MFLCIVAIIVVVALEAEDVYSVAVRGPLSIVKGDCTRGKMLMVIDCGISLCWNRVHRVGRQFTYLRG
jgi:hypothetical protein